MSLLNYSFIVYQYVGKYGGMNKILKDFLIMKRFKKEVF